MNTRSASHLIAACICAALTTPLASAFQDKTPGVTPIPAWVILSCNGKKQVRIDTKEQKTETESTDRMKVVRHRRTLLVTINGAEMKSATNRESNATDLYTIANEGKDGLAATQGDTLYPTAHSLVIDALGTFAIWTETTFTWYSSPVEPMSTTVLFTCRK